MKITLLGNCQTKALTWYIQQLNENFDVKWLQPEFAREFAWARPGIFREKSTPTITGTENSIERLKRSSFLIYQPISPATSKNFNFEKIKSYNPECNFISISSFFYEPEDSQEEALKGMIDRANKYNIDIPAHKIIEKHGAKIEVQQKNHPKVFYFLELVREICKKTGWDYYSDEQYNQYLEEGYPFG
jgi:hypothetical protein